MREIKFRGKKIDNGEWMYGYYFKLNDKHKIHVLDDIISEVYSVDPATIGQHIRTIERNKIFEGDIVKAYKHGNKEEEPYIHEILWRDGTYWFGKWTFLEFLRVFRCVEVIGNIYDNPELMNE